MTIPEIFPTEAVNVSSPLLLFIHRSLFVNEQLPSEAIRLSDAVIPLISWEGENSSTSLSANPNDSISVDTHVMVVVVTAGAGCSSATKTNSIDEIEPKENDAPLHANTTDDAPSSVALFHISWPLYSPVEFQLQPEPSTKRLELLLYPQSITMLFNLPEAGAKVIVPPFSI